MNQDQNNNVRWQEWISLPALATGLIYVTGWAYAYAYFEKFHLGLLSIDIPGQYYIIYGFWVLRDHWWLIFVYLGLIGLWRRYGRYGRHPRIDRGIVAALIPLLILSFFIGAYQLARYSAAGAFQAQQQQDYPAYPRVRLWLKDRQEPALQAVAEQLPKGCYRLLLQSRGQAMLFYSHKDTPRAHLAILQIPMSQVRAMRILPQYRSCS